MLHPLGIAKLRGFATYDGDESHSPFVDIDLAGLRRCEAGISRCKCFDWHPRFAAETLSAVHTLLAGVTLLAATLQKARS